MKDKVNFEMIYNKYNKRIFNFLYHFTGNRWDAEDLLQDVWLAFIKNMNNFRGDSTVFTYLTRIAINKALKWHKKRKLKEKVLSLLKINEPENPEDIAIKNDLNALIKKAINELPPVQKAVVILRINDEMNFKDIGKILNISEGSARTSYFYAIQKLKEKFNSEEGK